MGAKVYMIKKVDKIDNTLIIRRRRKIFIQRLFVFIAILSVAAWNFCMRYPGFNITSITVENNKYNDAKKIISLSGLQTGNNIFYIKASKGSDKIMGDPYFTSVKISRKLPSSIVIRVVEREATYYASKDNKFAVIDKNGILLEVKADISNMKLIKLDGFDMKKSTVGKQIVGSDERQIQVIETLAGMESAKDFMAGLASLDLTNPGAINIYSGQICIKLGTTEDFEKKLNTAANILQRDELKQAKGYIDVSFDGNPVFFIEK
jgi:cell division protein FtsQ